MILLNDILQMSKEEIANTKIRFNQSSGEFDPIELFKSNNKKLYDGHFWNYSKVKSFKEGQIAIGFIRLSNDKWLLFDISYITKDLNKFNDTSYEYETISKYQKYFGRLIIKYKNKSQNMIRKAETVIDDCEIYEIINDRYEDDMFPGYENVNLTWKQLKNVIIKKDWKTALENQKGIYLITDTKNGKRYVGSAYGENMLYGRWYQYVQTCHGGNKDLKQLSNAYIQSNFKYSILEIYKSTTEDSIIIRREHYWMDILMSKNKSFGYNN